MAAIKLPKFASDINLDVPRDQMLAESAYALKHVENHLIHHLWIGRTLAAAKRELQADGINEASGHYSAALNGWIKEHQPKLQGLHKTLRADSIWCIENWPNVQPILKRIEQDDPHLHQMLGARGLRGIVEKEMSPLDKRRKPEALTRIKPPTQAELIARELETFQRAAFISGLTVDPESGMFVVSNETSYQGWRNILRDIAERLAKKDEADPKPDAPSPPPWPTDGRRRPLVPHPKAAGMSSKPNGDPGPTPEDIHDDGEGE